MEIIFKDGSVNLEKVVELYSKNLILFINKFVNNYNISEDLMMDTYASILVSKTKFKNQSCFKTYLFAIAKNKSFDYIKNKKE